MIYLLFFDTVMTTARHDPEAMRLIREDRRGHQIGD
jgi:hypothetical protein